MKCVISKFLKLLLIIPFFCVALYSCAPSPSPAGIYTITWKNYNGDILKDEKYNYGEIPSYKDADPQKPETIEYVYTFSGWTPKIEKVIDNKVYTATFVEKLRSYSVKWYNGQTLLKTDFVEYGTIPVYTGSTPTKSSTDQYTYTFSGWSPSVTRVTGSVEYYAQFSSTVRSYDIKWYNGDSKLLETDSVKYGEMPVYTGPTPTKSSTDQYTYTFSGWSPSVTRVTGSTSYYAQFASSTRKYNVVWKNYDGKIIKVDNCQYGSIPEYDGEVPKRDQDERHIYTFNNWKPSPHIVKGEQEYTAEYTVKMKYLIKFINDDDSFLKSYYVPEGETPVFEGTPSKTKTEKFEYTFSGWDSNIVPATMDKTYKATYSASIRKYKISWMDDEGNILKIDNIPYGAMPSYGETPKKECLEDDYMYVFVDWSPQLSPVVGEATYTASFRKAKISENILTISYTNPWGPKTTFFTSYKLNYEGSIKKVDWGDGTIDSLESHIYYGAGDFEKTIKIYGVITSLENGTAKTQDSDGGSYTFNAETNVVLGDTITSIKEKAFSGKLLKSIFISKNVTNIEKFAIYNCPELTSIVVDLNNKKYDSRDNCNAIIETQNDSLIIGCISTIVPNSITTIADYAFYGSQSPVAINIPKNVTSIGSYSFYGLDDAKFEQKLESITFEKDSHLTSIGMYAFKNCRHLTSLCIPNSVTSIGSGAFALGMNRYGEKLSILIPKNVINMGSVVFDRRENSVVYCAQSQKPDGWDKEWAGLAGYTPTIYWNVNDVIVDNEIEYIPIQNEGTFFATMTKCRDTKSSIIIPTVITYDNKSIPVTSIGDCTFQSCYSLVSVTIPSSITSIGEGAFAYCSQIKSITIPASVTKMGSDVFKECSSLKDIYCEIQSQPEGWDVYWKGRFSKATVHWGVKL